MAIPEFPKHHYRFVTTKGRTLELWVFRFGSPDLRAMRYARFRCHVDEKIKEQLVQRDDGSWRAVSRMVSSGVHA